MSTTEEPRTTGSGRRRPGELRATLVRAALDELSTPVDPEILSLRKVARRAGVTPPAVYLYFADRQQLVMAVLERLFAELSAACDAAADRHGPPRLRLAARGLAYAGFGVAHPGHYKVMYEGRGLSTLSDPSVLGLGMPILLGVHAELTALGLDAQRVPARALQLWQAIHGAVSLRINKPEAGWQPIQHDIEAFVHLLTADLDRTPGNR